MNRIDRVREVVGPSPVIGEHSNGSLLVLGHDDPETAMYDLHRAGWLVLFERETGTMVIREKRTSKKAKRKTRINTRKKHSPGADGAGAAK